jgi:hypothetical protein
LTDKFVFVRLPCRFTSEDEGLIGLEAN